MRVFVARHATALTRPSATLSQRERVFGENPFVQMLAWIPLLVGMLSAFPDRVAAADPPAAEASEDAPIRSSRELLALYGADAKRLATLVDGSPIDPSEQDALLRMLVAVRRFTLGEVERWKQPEQPVSKLADNPAAHRGEIFNIAGFVRRVSIEEPPADLADRFQIERYYRCELAIGEAAEPAVVYALKVPKAWKVNEPIDERVGVKGFFVKLGGQDPLPLAPVFAAQRVAWYPQNVLGDLEMDAGLFDDVQNRTPIGLNDRECFYEMLAASSRALTAELMRRTRETFSVEPLFNRPDQQRGKLIALTGTAERALLIHIEDPDVVEAYGIDHYYEIEMVTGDSEGNPIAFCVLQLPPGMKTGENIQVDVRIAGFFFKTWAFRPHASNRARAADDNSPKVRYQIAPLLIGREPYLLPKETGNPYLGVIAGALFVVGVAGAWIGVWWLNREDRQFTEKTMSKRFEPKQGTSLNDLGLEDHDLEDHGEVQVHDKP
jgi:hypothetical protein